MAFRDLDLGHGHDRRSHGARLSLPRRRHRLGVPCFLGNCPNADADFCVEALEEAIQHFGRPETFNTGQGAQFTREAFPHVLERNHICISMDGKGRWMDNVFVERLWLSVKVEDIYLKAYNTVNEAGEGLANYFRFYNHERRHQTLGTTPWEASTRTMAEAA